MAHIKEQPPKKPSGYLESVGLWDKLTGFLFGDDIFISYSHDDALDYALALARSLSKRKFVCYLDQYGTDAKDELPPALIRRLKRSIVLVLIGTGDSVQSEFVKEEVRIFTQTERPTIPINVGSAFDQARWIKIVKGNPVSHEKDKTDKPALNLNGKTDEFILKVEPEQVVDVTEEERRSVNPSSLTVNRIISSFKYTKRADRQKRMFLAAFILLLTSFVAVAVSANEFLDVTLQAADAEQREVLAQKAVDKAEEDVKKADMRRLAAERLRKEAEDLKLIAETNTQLAVTAKNRADEQAALAKEREAAAKQAEARATASAKEQGDIASSRQLAARAFTVLDTELDTSLRLSEAAHRKQPTAEAQSSLLKGVQRYIHLQKLLRMRGGPIAYLALTPDGEILAWAEYAKVVFWDIPNNRELASFKVGFVGNIIASPNGKRFAAWTSGLTIIVWEVTGSREHRKVEHLGQPFTFPFADEFLQRDTSLAFNSDGSTLIFGQVRQRDDSPSIFGPMSNKSIEASKNIFGLVFLNIDTKEEAFRPTREQSYIKGLKLSPDLNTLAVAHNDSIELWDVKRKAVMPRILTFAGQEREIIGNNEPVPEFRPRSSDHDWFSSLAFSLDGKTLASARQSNTVILWDVMRREMLGDPLKDAGSEVTFTSQGKSLATIKRDGILTFWTVAAEGAQPLTKVWSEVYREGLSSLASDSLNGNTLLTGNTDSTIAFWKIDATSQLGRTYQSEPPYHLAFNSEGDLLLSISYSKGNRILWDFSSRRGTLSLSTRSQSTLKEGAFSALAIKEKDFAGIFLQDALYPSDEPTKLQIKHNGSTWRERPAVSPDGKRLAAFEESAIVLWDITDRGIPRRISSMVYDPNDGPRCAAFSHNGKLLVAGYASGKLVLWDLTGRNKRKIFSVVETRVSSPFNGVLSVAVSDDGKTVASSNESKEMIYLWDASTSEPTLLGTLDRQIPQSSGGPYSAWSLTFSLDGKKLIMGSADGITVWDIDSQSWLKRAEDLFSYEK